MKGLLPVVSTLLAWLDDRFAVLVLDVGAHVQDTVVRLRTTNIAPVTVGGVVTPPRAGSWLEVTTTVGAMVQPVVIACALVAGWPAAWRTRVIGLAVALPVALAFMCLDTALTLHAFVWGMFVEHYEPGRFSPLLIWHDAMHSGGRLGVGVLLGALIIAALSRRRIASD